MSPPSGSDPGGRAARAAARQERRARAERRYQLLETARRERRAHTRAAVRDAMRLPAVPNARTLAVIVVGVAVLAVLIIWLGSRSSPEPLVARSCTTPALALGRGQTGDGSGIAWSATGPREGAYTVVVDGRTVASPPLDDCAADGTLPPLSAGSHRVELRRDGRPVASAQLTG